MNDSQPSNTQPIEQFWQSYLASLPAGQAARYTRQPEAWGFGDDQEMADELGNLVADGIKTATCSLVWEYEAGNEPIPQVGDLSIILDGRGLPLCIIETTQIRVMPFSQVDAAFAYDEGEDDRSLQSWREGHLRFFGRSCRQIGKELDEQMPVVCERFHKVWPVTSDGGRNGKN